MPYRDSQHAYPLHQRRWACIRLPRRSFSPADRRVPNGPIRCRNDGRQVPQNPRSVRETEHAYLLLLGDRCARPFGEHHGRSAVLACCAMFLAMQLTQWLTHCQRFDVSLGCGSRLFRQPSRYLLAALCCRYHGSKYPRPTEIPASPLPPWHSPTRTSHGPAPNRSTDMQTLRGDTFRLYSIHFRSFCLLAMAVFLQHACLSCCVSLLSM